MFYNVFMNSHNTECAKMHENITMLRSYKNLGNYSCLSKSQFLFITLEQEHTDIVQERTRHKLIAMAWFDLI